MISFAKSLDENQTFQMAKYLSTLKRTEQEEVYELEFDNTGDGGSWQDLLGGSGTLY